MTLFQLTNIWMKGSSSFGTVTWWRWSTVWSTPSLLSTLAPATPLDGTPSSSGCPCHTCQLGLLIHYSFETVPNPKHLWFEKHALQICWPLSVFYFHNNNCDLLQTCQLCVSDVCGVHVRVRRHPLPLKSCNSRKSLSSLTWKWNCVYELCIQLNNFCICYED